LGTAGAGMMHGMAAHISHMIYPMELFGAEYTPKDMKRDTMFRDKETLISRIVIKGKGIILY